MAYGLKFRKYYGLTSVSCLTINVVSPFNVQSEKIDDSVEELARWSRKSEHAAKGTVVTDAGHGTIRIIGTRI